MCIEGIVNGTRENHSVVFASSLLDVVQCMRTCLIIKLVGGNFITCVYNRSRCEVLLCYVSLYECRTFLCVHTSWLWLALYHNRLYHVVIAMMGMASHGIRLTDVFG